MPSLINALLEMTPLQISKGIIYTIYTIFKQKYLPSLSPPRRGLLAPIQVPDVVHLQYGV